MTEKEYHFNRIKWIAGMAAALQIAENYLEAVMAEDINRSLEASKPGKDATSKQIKAFEKRSKNLWSKADKRLKNFKSNHKGTLEFVRETSSNNEVVIESLVDLFSGLVEKSMECSYPMVRVNVGEPHISIEKDLYIEDGGVIGKKKVLSFKGEKRVLI